MIDNMVRSKVGDKYDILNKKLWFLKNFKIEKIWRKVPGRFELMICSLQADTLTTEQW